MTPQDDMLREIERNEAWLRELSLDPSPPNAEHLKLMTRIVADEQWLERQLAVTPPDSLAGRLKTLVHATQRDLDQSSHARRTRRLVLRWAGGLAAAAAIAIFMLSNQATTPQTDDEFAVAGILEESNRDEYDITLEALHEDLQELEWGSDGWIALDSEENEFETLWEQIEGLAANDWAEVG